MQLYFPAFICLDEVERLLIFFSFAAFIAHLEGDRDFRFSLGCIGIGGFAADDGDAAAFFFNFFTQFHRYHAKFTEHDLFGDALLFGFGRQIDEGGSLACITVNEGFEEGLRAFFRASGGVGNRCSSGGKAKQQGADEVFSWDYSW